MSDYISDAIRTENQDFAGIGKRLEENAARVLPALNRAILAMQELDYVVKKECFYGKSPKKYEAPQFSTATMDQAKTDILASKSFIRLLHGFMGVGTEAGEGLEALASFFNTGELDKVNVGEELGDCFWYEAIIADECGTTFAAEQEKNINKLKARYQEKFTADESANRDLGQERQVLENHLQ